MRFDAILKFVGHKIGNGLTVSADDERPTGIFHRGQERGKMGLGFMHIDSLHTIMLVQLVRHVNSLLDMVAC